METGGGSAWGRLADALPPWLWAVLLSLPFRLPILFRPEPGRDEAAYYYWSRHVEWAYAPLLQLLVRAAEALPVPDVVALRVPALAAGVAVLWLFDRWMLSANASPGIRWVGLAALAVSPWQTYAGSLLHPDGLFLAALLGFLLAASSGRVLLTAVAVVAAVWAKPTGLLLVPVAAGLAWTSGIWRTRRTLIGSGLLALGILPVAVAWDSAMVREILGFGMHTASWPGSRLLDFASWTLVAGGVLLPLGGLGALRASIRPEVRDGPPWRAAIATAATLLVVFGTAAILRGQFKPNWILPAFVILWPFAPPPPRPLVRWGMAGAIACSAVLALAIGWRAKALPADAPGSPAIAEAGFLGSALLEHELGEWRSIEGFAREIEHSVLDSPGTGEESVVFPSRIVGEDYGLAAQLAFRWRDANVQVDVPASPFFAAAVAEPLAASRPTAGTLTVFAWSGASRPEGASLLSHPVSGRPLAVRLAATDSFSGSGSNGEPCEVAGFDSLLVRYRTDSGVRYAAWKANPRDLAALSKFVDSLEGSRPSQWGRDRALAYWINLYNAATLELVLAHYPVKSIKDIGGVLSSPWKRKVVRVEGRDLTLDDIEHDVIRKRFADPRIHFALNCASVGCPPLAATAYGCERLEDDLDRACRLALNHPRWTQVLESQLRITRLFDWYRGDFERNRGSVREFLARYRPDDRDAILDPNRKIEYLEYDWSLNEVR